MRKDNSWTAWVNRALCLLLALAALGPMAATGAGDTVNQSGSRLECTYTFIPNPLPDAQVGVDYNVTLTASGGMYPYTYSITAGALPPGLMLEGFSGMIFGTPTYAGSYTFTLTALDYMGCPGTQDFTLVVTCPYSVTLSPGSLPGGMTGVYYSQTLVAGGGISPYSYWITSGVLPGGLSLNPSTGVISGTPSYSGTSSFAVTAADSSGCAASKSYSILINCTSVISISPASLSDGVAGVAYSATVTASGGNAPYAYSVTSGTIPAGLFLSASTGAISGTPSEPGSFSFTVTATDGWGCKGSRAYNMSVICTSTITVSPPAIPNGTVGVPYTQTLSGSGGVAPYYFTITSGTIPPGLSFNPETGVISGTPTTQGAYGFTVKATDAVNCYGTIGYPLTIAPSCSLSCTATVPTNGNAGTPVNFSSTVTYTGCTGTPNYEWSFGDSAASALQSPSHTYASAGTYNWTLTVTVDTQMCVQAGTITILPPPPLVQVIHLLWCPEYGFQIYGSNFQSGIVGFVNGSPVPLTEFIGPNEIWLGGQGLKTMAPPGTMVSLSLHNPDGGVSNPFSYMGPTEYDPTITQQPLTQDVADGQTVTLTVASNPTAYCYTWYKLIDGTPVPVGGNSSSYTTPPIHTNETYRVRVGSDSGEATSQDALLNVCSLTCTAQAPTAGWLGQPVQFSSQATVAHCLGTESYSWSFGDGGTSTEQNTRHSYAAAGTYSWTLRVNVGSVTCEQAGTVTVCSLTCTATVPARGQVGTPVSFASYAGASCTGSIAYSWDFGDGATSIEQNPSHTYTAAGLFSWRLTVTQQGQTCSKGGSISVESAPQLSCSASATPTSGAAPLLVTFSGSASGGVPPYAFNWTFGDGHSSTEASPTHTYTAPGSYTARLRVTDSTQTAVSDCEVPIAVSGGATCTLACTATVPTGGEVGVSVAFSSSATATDCTSAPAYNWNFGDGGTSSLQNPSHTYTAPGTYTWSLTVTADDQTCAKSGTITVVSPCSLACTATVPAAGTVNRALSFASTASPSGCTGSPVFLWTFGDGGSSPDQNPLHTYTAAGTYQWQLTVTVQNVNCTRNGEVVIGTLPPLTCTASAEPPSGGVPLTVTFTSSASGGEPPYVSSWSFGDGQTSTEQNPVHEYAAAGTYTWTLTVTAANETCRQTGVVVATIDTGSIHGRVGVLPESQLKLLDGPGIVSGTASARFMTTGDVFKAPVSGGHFEILGLPPGDYEVWVDLTYKDNISYSSLAGEMGCATPTGGFINKEISSIPQTVHLPVAYPISVDISFPMPLVFLHGFLDCYKKWYSASQADPSYWDNLARSSGIFSFTPGYSWGSDINWDNAAAQVAEQLAADLSGLHSPGAPPYANFLPYQMVTHDAGGLVARVLASGSLSASPEVEAAQEIYMIGTPNSGSDLLFGQGAGSPVSEYSIVQRFNEIYPDFGPAAGKVYAVGGTKSLWGQLNGDGKVSLASAFNISKLHCDPTAGTPTSTQYVYCSFDSSSGHTFHFSHGELGGPPSAASILQGVIMAGLGAEGAVTPESPAGGIIWGTNSRTVGTASGTAAGATESNMEYPFTIGASDGVAVMAWVTEGSAAFDVLDPSGTVVKGTDVGEWETGFEFQALDPAEGEWKLRVTPSSPGTTFKAVFVENGTYGFYGYTDEDGYRPGAQAILRLDPVGDTSNVSFGSASAAVYDPSGGLIQTVQLYDDGSHQDGGAGDGRYAAHFTAPQLPGSYRLKFGASGSYSGVPFSRSCEGSLEVLESTRVFTGQFDFTPVDSDASGKWDAISFTAQTVFPDTTQAVFSADLYDSAGNLIDRVSKFCGTVAAGPGTVQLSFSLSGIKCSQFMGALSAGSIAISDSSTLAPVDVWENSAASPAYDPNDFDCEAGAVQPELIVISPDEGIRGQAATLNISGKNFEEGCGVSLGESITVGSTVRVSGELLSVAAIILQNATTGKRSVTVTNPGGASGEIQGAFEVKEDRPPTVLLQAPQEGATLSGSATVSASATDDLGVEEVNFLVDGSSKAAIKTFPFIFTWNTKDTRNGEHTIQAVAKDGSGQTGSSQVVKVVLSNAVTPGDCDGSGIVSIGEVQKAINMFLGTAQPDCGVDCSGDGKVSIGEVQKVINAFLGLPSSC